MSYETVTVTCGQHRRRCTWAPAPKGGGIRIRHAGPGDTGLCDSQRFTIRREQKVDRGGAWAELLRLDCIEQAQAALDASPAPETRSLPDGPARED